MIVVVLVKHGGDHDGGGAGEVAVAVGLGLGLGLQWRALPVKRAPTQAQDEVRK